MHRTAATGSTTGTAVAAGALARTAGSAGTGNGLAGANGSAENRLTRSRSLRTTRAGGTSLGSARKRSRRAAGRLLLLLLLKPGEDVRTRRHDRPGGGLSSQRRARNRAGLRQTWRRTGGSHWWTRDGRCTGRAADRRPRGLRRKRAAGSDGGRRRSGRRTQNLPGPGHGWRGRGRGAHSGPGRGRHGGRGRRHRRGSRRRRCSRSSYRGRGLRRFGDHDGRRSRSRRRRRRGRRGRGRRNGRNVGFAGSCRAGRNRNRRRTQTGEWGTQRRSGTRNGRNRNGRNKGLRFSLHLGLGFDSGVEGAGFGRFDGGLGRIRRFGLASGGNRGSGPGENRQGGRGWRFHGSSRRPRWGRIVVLRRDYVNHRGVVARESTFDRLRDARIDRARVSLLLADAEFGKQFDDCARGYFQLSGQLVDTNRAHKDAAFGR